MGTDSAPHETGRKECDCGAAGCFTAVHCLELYAAAFEAAGALEHLDAFVSSHGARFYGLPRCEGVNAGARVAPLSRMSCARGGAGTRSW